MLFTISVLVGCGGILTRPLGNISSPGYARGNYSNNEECVWYLNNQNQTSSSIFIVFNTLQTEWQARCGFDFLEVKEGKYSSIASVLFSSDSICKITNFVVLLCYCSIYRSVSESEIESN